MKDLASVPMIPELEHAKHGVYVCPACDHIGTKPILCPACERQAEARPNAE